MKKFKSLFIGLAGVSAVALPLVAVSCNGGQAKYIEKDKRITKDVIKVNDTLESKIKELKEVPTIAFITESGDILDQSFNQSGWEAVLDLIDQFKAADKKLVAKPIEPVTGSKLTDQYSALLAAGTQIWILSGYAHGDELPAFINANSEQLIKNNVKIIGLDYNIQPDQITVPFKDLYTVSYKVQAPAYVVGQAVSDYLVKYSGTNKTTTTFGGGNYDGVTAFMNGYVKGIYSYDKANADAKVQVKTSGPDNKLEINSGFAADPKMDSAITAALQTNSKVILPVAGTATANLVTKLSQSNGNNSVIIGVDADQSKAFPGKEGLFITSITKNLGQTVYDALLFTIFGINNPTNVFDAKATKVQALVGDLSNNWVGYAPSTLSNEDERNYVNQKLNDYKTAFLSANEETKNFVYTNSTLPGQAGVDTVTGVAVADAVVAEINKIVQ
ncbi:hypothetical protein [Mycoplasma seminis]|uniref:BMP family ABC transporter substrate-binding protein n=1 Tax=Mycoplasma seminis TaxID=512749 RepID=A0ABY9HD83_9MOLU|nr:hypothetical protein [Mycoplasma seminis]WLP85638.1 hypothetical protein Q8852_00550 [Mycoplasma seminis]